MDAATGRLLQVVQLPSVFVFDDYAKAGNFWVYLDQQYQPPVWSQTSERGLVIEDLEAWLKDPKSVHHLTFSVSVLNTPLPFAVACVWVPPWFKIQRVTTLYRSGSSSNADAFPPGACVTFQDRGAFSIQVENIDFEIRPRNSSPPARLPDLAAEIRRPGTNDFPQGFGPGATGNLMVTVTNKGVASVQGLLPFHLYMTTNPILNKVADIPLRVMNTPISLPPSGAMSLCLSPLTLPTWTPPDGFYLHLDVDPGNVFAESREDNNIASIAIKPLPDLTGTLDRKSTRLNSSHT